MASGRGGLSCRTRGGTRVWFSVPRDAIEGSKQGEPGSDLALTEPSGCCGEEGVLGFGAEAGRPAGRTAVALEGGTGLRRPSWGQSTGCATGRPWL